MARRRRRSDFRFQFLMRRCDGKYIFRAEDIEPVREWLEAEIPRAPRPNYRTMPAFAGRWSEGALVLMDDQTQAVHFMLRWGEEVVNKKDRGYSRYY